MSIESVFESSAETIGRILRDCEYLSWLWGQTLKNKILRIPVAGEGEISATLQKITYDSACRAYVGLFLRQATGELFQGDVAGLRVATMLEAKRDNQAYNARLTRENEEAKALK